MPDSQMKVLPPKELSLFFDSLAMLLQAGVPANEAPGIIAEDMEGGLLARGAKKVDEILSSGEVFVLSEALEKSGAFPAYAVEMTRIGEDSGRMETTALSLGKYFESQDNLNQSIRSAISGPLLLLVMMSVVLLFLILFVLPVFERVFASLGVAGGGGMGGAFVAARVSMVVVGVILLGVLALVVAYFAPGGRDKLAKLAERFPLTKRIHYAISASRFTNVLSMLLASGISGNEALEKAGPLVDNHQILDPLPKTIEDTAAGEDLGKALVANDVLSGFEAKILVSASKSGKTEEAMRHLSELYSSEAENGIDRLLGMVEPALVGLLSVAIGVILLSVMLPLTSIMSAIT